MSDEQVFNGTVVFFSNKLNYGFLNWEKDGVLQPDLFIHYSDIVMKDGGFKTLKKDDKVQFKIGINVRNQPKATEVSVVE